MLGMAATNLSTTAFGTNARKRGQGWEANWFVAQAAVQILFAVIMGTRNSQAPYNAEKDADGLYQGGFGTGVTDMPDWDGYNAYYPVIPTSVGLEMGDGTGLVEYGLPASEAAEDREAPYKTFQVPVFFGLVHAGYGHLWRWTRGLTVSQEAGVKTEVYVAPSMYADFNPNSVEGLLKVAECPQCRGLHKAREHKRAVHDAYGSRRQCKHLLSGLFLYQRSDADRPPRACCWRWREQWRVCGRVLHECEQRGCECVCVLLVAPLRFRGRPHG